MKNRFCLCICFTLVILNCNSQTYNKSAGVDKKTFKKIVNDQFSALVTGQSKTGVGNFASLDLSKSEVSFSANLISGQGNVFGLKASGGVNDGVFSAFKNSTPNSNFSLQFQASFFNLKDKRISYVTESLTALDKKKEAIEKKYQVSKIEVENNLELINMRYTSDKTRKMLDQLKKRLDVEKNSLTRDSLTYAISMNEYLLKETDSLISVYHPVLIEDIDNRRAIELEELKPEIEIVGFKFKWVSLSYKLANNEFKRFIADQQFDRQVEDTSFLSHELSVQYNTYNWTNEPFQSYFYCFGISLSVADNFSDLTGLELADVKYYGVIPGERSTTKKSTVYSGDYKTGIGQARIYGDYYRFISRENTAAVHIYPEIILRNSGKPVYNAGLGFLCAFKDSKKDDDKSIINAEIFFTLVDIANHTGIQHGFFGRNNLGIRFTFPINFINKQS